MTVRIRLLGRVSVERDGQPPTGLPAKALELLCFLLLHRDRAHTRDELSAVLWPDATSALGRKYLRRALWQLQSALAAELLVLSPGWVRAGADGDWWLDVDNFERAWEASRDVAGRTDRHAGAGAGGSDAGLFSLTATTRSGCRCAGE